MGGGGSQTTKTSEQTKTGPWAGQEPHLKEIFGQAQNTYEDRKRDIDDGNYYKGDLIAQATDAEKTAFGSAFNRSTDTSGADAVTGAGKAMIPAGQQMIGQSAGGLYNLAGDQTDPTIANAGKYAQNPYMDGMVDAAMRDSRRTMAESTMPGIARDAAATGNMNSTRRGIAEGVAARGLAEKTADVSAGLRGDAWKTGLGMAGDDLNRRLQASTALGGLGSDVFQGGVGAVGAGTDINGKQLDQTVLSDSMLQGFRQAEIDNTIGKQDYRYNLRNEALGNYYGMVGDKSWGSEGTSSGTSVQKQNPSALSTIGSGMAIMGSLFRCDERVKNVIEKLDFTMAGFPCYIFTYKDDPNNVAYVGPMAQDVEKVNPDAIVEIDGVKHINFRKL